MNPREFSNMVWSLSETMKQGRRRRRLETIRELIWPLVAVAIVAAMNWPWH